MLTINEYAVPSADQWLLAVKGMRNPMNSWHMSDSDTSPANMCDYTFELGEADEELMLKLINSGPEHRKFMRQLPVIVDVTAPLYWWKEADTYKVGTACNSCSTMHKIAAKEFTLSDFSCEHLNMESIHFMLETIKLLNRARVQYLETKEKEWWWQLIQLLPASYNQTRTLSMNYEVLFNIYAQRKGHKLDEWRTFRDWMEELPYYYLITRDV